MTQATRSYIIEGESLDDLAALFSESADAIIIPAPEFLLETTAILQELPPEEQDSLISFIRRNAVNVEKPQEISNPDTLHCLHRLHKASEKLKSALQQAVSGENPCQVETRLKPVGYLRNEKIRAQKWHLDDLRECTLTWTPIGNGTSFVDGYMTPEERFELLNQQKFPSSGCSTRTMGNAEILFSRQVQAETFRVDTGLIHRADNVGQTRISMVTFVPREP